jgi:DNA-binding GntR family transcriptional regulator
MTEDALISLLSAATSAACQQMTPRHLKALHDSAEYAFSLPARPQWRSKAAAHAEMFTLLAGVADHPVTSAVPGAVHFMRQLIITVGPAADGMITSSHRRLLAHLGAGHADEAALEMERHLRGLHYMWRLTGPRGAAGTCS